MPRFLFSFCRLLFAFCFLFAPTLLFSQDSTYLKNDGSIIIRRKAITLAVDKPVFERYAVLTLSKRVELSQRILDSLNALPDVEYAEPNYIWYKSGKPNDPRYNEQYGHQSIKSEPAWNKAKGSKEIIIGIVDTGIDYSHEDLQANIWENPNEIADGADNDRNGYVDDVHGYDFVNLDSDPFDDESHGTHVSGIAGATGNNGEGVCGVNWQVSLMALKFLDSDGSGTTFDAVQAILYAVDNGASVINASWGGGAKSRTLEDAIRYAEENNVLFVAAAGNDGESNDVFPTYPASYNLSNVIAVASVDHNDQPSWFSNYGQSVHIAAPGYDILSTVPNNGYDFFSGTSMAAPFVSGACALLKSASTTNSDSIKLALFTGVDSLDQGFVASGRLNLEKSLNWLGAVPAPNPVPPSGCGCGSLALYLGPVAFGLWLFRKK